MLLSYNITEIITRHKARIAQILDNPHNFIYIRHMRGFIKEVPGRRYGYCIYDQVCFKR